MSFASCCSTKVFVCALAVAAAAVFTRPGPAQSGPAIVVGSHQITGLAEDWSHRHVVFSNPGTEESAIKGDRYDEWLKIVNDPRYVMQQLKRGLPVQGPAAAEAAWAEGLARENRAPERRATMAPEQHAILPPILVNPKVKHKGNPTLNKDWNESLSTTAAPSASAYPAKWTNSITTADCDNDFVVYPAGQLGATNQASIIAYYNLYSGCGGTVPEVDWAYNTGGAVTLSPVFGFRGNHVAFVQTTGSGSVTANTTTNSKNFTVTSGTISANEVGSVVSATGIPAGDTLASVTDSTHGVLTTAVTTGGNGRTLTITGVSQLVLLTVPSAPPGTGTLTVPIAPTAETATAYYNSGSGCTAPCSFTVALNGNPADTLSNPYYDIASDTLFVGDSVGRLHKFAPVFKGVPAEVTTAWPVQMNHGSVDAHQLVSPIYDSTSGNVFVGSSGAAGGYFYAVTASTGGIAAFTAQLDSTNGIMDGPLVDPTAGKVYVFVGRDKTTNTRAGVYQLATNGSGWSTPGEAQLGTTAGGAAGAYEYVGTFDNSYFMSSNWASPSGYIYACNTASPSTLYQVKIVSNALSTVTAGPALTAGSGGHCSSISEFYNSYVGATAATGSVAVSTDPFFEIGETVTIGTETYTLEWSVTAKDQVQIDLSLSGSGNRESRTAQNLEAVVNNDSSKCYDSGCVYSGQTANASATATYAGTTVSLTATSLGTAGDFAVSSSNSGNFTLVPGNDGSDGTAEDLLFLSVYRGAFTTAGCTNSGTNGCIMAFNVATPGSFNSSTAPLGVQNLTSPAAAATGGTIIDNAALNLVAGGASQIYFVTQNAANTACVTGGANGVCAIQASQTAP